MLFVIINVVLDSTLHVYIYQKVPSIPSTGNCVNWSGSGTAIIQVCGVGGQSV